MFALSTTDRPTDTASYRGPLAHLKRQFFEDNTFDSSRGQCLITRTHFLITLFYQFYTILYNFTQFYTMLQNITQFSAEQARGLFPQ